MPLNDEATLAEQIDVHITRVPYRESYALVAPYFGALGLQRVENDDGTTLSVSQIGGGVRVQSARRTNIQLDLITGFRRIDVSEFGIPGQRNFNLWDILVGGRYYPLRPTF